MIANSAKLSSQTEMFSKPYAKYAYSLVTRRVKEPDFPYPQQLLTGTQAVVDFVKSLNDSDIEKMIALYLDAQNVLIAIQVMPGTVNQAVVYPREIMKHALLSSSSSLILVHNHPSGNVRPSEADIRLTKLIKDTGKCLDVTVHDHLIVSEKGVFSFREEGMMES